MIEPEYNKYDVWGNELSAEEKEWCSNNDVRMEPYTKKNWKTADSRDTWADLLNEASQGHYYSEWASVLSDKTDRQAAIIHINNYNREEWIERIAKHDLFFKPIRYSKPYGGFSHKFFPTDKHDKDRITYSVISTDEDVAEQFYEAETASAEEMPDRHDVIGNFLNFPECCREHFQKAWVEGGHIDPMYEISCNSGNAEAIDGDNMNVLIKDPSPYASVLYRYYGWAFLTHLPCSWDCERSIEIGRKRGEIMAEGGYKDGANALYNWLKEPMVWTGHNANAHIRNQHMIGAAGTSTYWNKKRIVWGEEHDAGGSII